MDASSDFLSSVGSIGYFLAAFPALWIAGRIILRNYSGGHRAAQFILWLALGGLFFTPITDALRYLSSVVELIIPWFWNSFTINVFLGMGPFMAYSAIQLALGITVYGFALYYLRTMILQVKITIPQTIKIENRELGFILLGIAGLANHMVSGLVIGVVSIYLPSLVEGVEMLHLSKGFWISWLLGLLVLLVTLWIMNERLARRQEALLQIGSRKKG